MTWLAYGGVDKSFAGLFEQIRDLPLIWISLIVLFVLFLTLLFRKEGKKDVQKASVTTKIEVSALALSLIFFPACLMAVSVKYQRLPWGLGYIVVLYQYFGYGLLSAILISWLWSKFPRSRTVIYAALVVYGICLITVNQANTHHNIAAMDAEQRTTTAKTVELIGHFAKSDVFSDIAQKGDAVCSNKREQYYYASYSDDIMTPLDEYTPGEKDVYRVVLYNDCCIAVGKVNADNMKTAEDPLIF